MIKGSIHQEDVAIINVHAPNIKAPKFTRHKLKKLNEEMGNYVIQLGDYNAPSSSIDRTTGTKIKSKDKNNQNSSINCCHLMIFIEHYSQQLQNIYPFKKCLLK